MLKIYILSAIMQQLRSYLRRLSISCLISYQYLSTQQYCDARHNLTNIISFGEETLNNISIDFSLLQIVIFMVIVSLLTGGKCDTLLPFAFCRKQLRI